MSLEDFKNKYPAEQALKAIVEGRREKRGIRGRSLVGILAEELVSDAASGFKLLTAPLSREVVGIVPDMSLMQKLEPSAREGAFTHIAAVVFGISVVCLEDSLASMQFDASDWSARYNLATSGTIVPKSEVMGLPVENIAEGGWMQMLRMAGNDKTLTIFFDGNMDNMPESLRRIIDRANSGVRIRDKIIPMYRERASFLID